VEFLETGFGVDRIEDCALRANELKAMEKLASSTLIDGTAFVGLSIPISLWVMSNLAVMS
jgi:hypothetical protein